MIERAKSTGSMVDQMSRAIAKGDGANFNIDPFRYPKLALAALKPLTRPTAAIDAAHEAVWFDAFWAIKQSSKFQEGLASDDPGSDDIRVLTNVGVGISVGSEKSVPEEVDHREIAVRVQMVDKVKLLLSPKPSEACEARSFGVVLLVEIHVRAERRRTGDSHHDEQIERKKKKHCSCAEDCRDEKVGRVVSFVASMSRGYQMALRIVCMMKSDVVTVENTAHSVMAKAIMEQGLAARYHQMGSDGS